MIYTYSESTEEEMAPHTSLQGRAVVEKIGLALQRQSEHVTADILWRKKRLCKLVSSSGRGVTMVPVLHGGCSLTPWSMLVLHNMFSSHIHDGHFVVAMYY